VKNLEKNIQKIYAIKFFMMFLVLMPVLIPFFSSLGLKMKEVFLLLSVFSGACFLFEVPSGYISDLLGRRKTLIFSSILKGTGFSLFAIADGFEILIVAEIILGAAVSLSSGTDTAIIYDTLLATNSKKAQIKILGKSIYFLTIGEGIASLLASLLMFLSFTVDDLVYISAYMSWIPFFISLTLVEPPRSLMGSEHKENLRLIYTKLFKESVLLKLILLNMVFYFAATMLGVWTFQKYWEALHIPIIYFGVLWALTNFAAAYASKTAHKIEKRWGSEKVLIFIGLLPVVSFFGIGLVDHIVGFIFCLLFQVCRGLGQVILKDALNKRVTGDFRATANSIAQMGTRIFFVCISPLFGYLIDNQSLSRACFYMGAVYILIFILVLLPIIKQSSSFEKIKKGSY
jgi:MFS family permease